MTSRPQVRNPHDPKEWCQEAAVLMEKQDYKGALYCYEQAVRFYPPESQDRDAADVWYNIACLYEQTGSSDAAGGCFAASAKKFPSDYRFPAELARILALKGKYEEAMKYIDEALDINPYSALLYANKSGYLVFSGKADAALETADKALSLDTYCVPGYLHKAHSLILLGRIDDAADLLVQAGETIAEEPRILQMQANVFIRAERFGQALDAAEKLILLNEKDDAAWCMKGAAHAYLGETAKAETAFKKAVRLNPREKSYRENLAALKKK